MLPKMEMQMTAFAQIGPGLHMSSNIAKLITYPFKGTHCPALRFLKSHFFVGNN